MGKWQSTTIGALCASGAAQIQTGPFGSQLHAHEYVEDGVPVVPTEAIGDRRINHTVLPKISGDKAAALQRHLLRSGDILFARRGVQATGRSAIVREHEAGFVCGTGAIRLRLKLPASPVLPEYLSLILSDRTSIEWFKFHAIGATMPNLNEGIIKAFSFAAPPLVEQVAIASILSTLDDKIDLNRRMNETLEAIVQAIFKDWFVDFGPTRSKIQGCPPYLAPDLWMLFPDRLDENGKPEGWGKQRVDDLLELGYGKSLPASVRVHGECPVYGSGGVSGFHNDALLSPPSVIVGRKGTVGSVFWEDRPCFPIDTVFYVMPREVPLSFCFYLLGSLGLSEMNTDAAVPGLNRNNVYRLAGHWGDAAIRQHFDDLVSPFRRKMFVNDEEARSLVSTRDLLLPKLMSGEIRLRELESLLDVVG